MKLRILFLGDLVGLAGRSMFAKYSKQLREEHAIDALVVNGENSGNQGRGITPKIARFFHENGADMITTGNHIWYRKEIYSYLDEHDTILRPANFPSGSPGVGSSIINVKGYKIGFINLIGRTFMRDAVDCPFRTADSILTYLKHKTNMIFVDMHAEATSEKMAIAYHLAGKVSGVVGTHTHIQTADERILPGGTGYITDLGMAGSLNSVLGMKKDAIMQNFITQLPVRFTVDTEPPFVLSGVWMEVDTETGSTVAIERIRIVDNNLEVSTDTDI